MQNSNHLILMFVKQDPKCRVPREVHHDQVKTLCRIKLGWDNVPDEQHKAQWLRLIKDSPKLQEIQINRCFKPENFGGVRDAQLHCFSDGSRAGYGAVVYLRLVDDRKKIH